MSASDQFDVVDVTELAGDLRSEEPSRASWRESPSLDVLRVRPEKIAERSLVRKLQSSFEKADLVEGLDVWRKTSVNAEDLSFNDSRNSEVIEDLNAVFPWVRVSVLADAFIIEAVHSCDLSGLVVSAEKGNAVWVFQLEAEEEFKCFDRVIATIDEIAHEDIARVGNLSSLLKEFEQVVELTVDISTNGHGCTDWLDVALFNQEFLDFLTEDTKVTL